MSIVLIQRPTFNNADLLDRGMWALTNAAALARYWSDQSVAIGQRPTENMQDFDTWLRVQHDIEMALRGPLPVDGCARCMRVHCICSALDFEPEEFGY